MEQKKKEASEHLVALRYALKRPDLILFLDIETAGPQNAQYTTVIGWSMEGEYRYWMKRQPIHAFLHDLKRAQTITTFNGKAFDIPFLLREFPDLEVPHVHLDLMHLLWGGGMKGGQKKIEVELGIERPVDLRELRGWDAVKLWRSFGRTRQKEYLETLIRYNREDVMNMIPLLVHGAELHGEDSTGVRTLMKRGEGDMIQV